MKIQDLVSAIRGFKLRLMDAKDLKVSEDLDIQEVKAVCFTLGPYRNLTTLTASTLFLHPNCQVLNHGGDRILGNKKVDFLSDYSRSKFDRFIKFAIRISGKGRMGIQGGSITYSHAFTSEHEMKDLYEGTGGGMIKEEIKCLFWKESLRTSNWIRSQEVDLASIFKSDDRLRFLLPIRNPMDCAVSNLKTNHADLFRGLNNDSSIIETVQAILDEIFWFEALKMESPNRFFRYFEHEISREMLVSLADFLDLDQDEAWIGNALSAMTIKSGYEHDRELIDFFKGYVKEKGANFPELSKGLLAFAE